MTNSDHELKEYVRAFAMDGLLPITPTGRCPTNQAAPIQAELFES